MARCTDFIERYSALELGLTDASIAVLAARFNCLDVLSFDQRHFRAVFAPGGKNIRLLPQDSR